MIMPSFGPATIRSNPPTVSCSKLKKDESLPFSSSPILSPATGPSNGPPVIINAVDTAIISTMSGLNFGSKLITVAIA